MEYQIITYTKMGKRKQIIKNLTFEQCIAIHKEEGKSFPYPTIWENNGEGKRVAGY